MINSLYDLNKKVTDFANYIVKTACEETYSGSYSIEVEEACEMCNIESADFDKYRKFFEDEMNSRDELLEIYIVEDVLEISCALNYCRNYEWENGDDEHFGSFEGFQRRTILPFAQPQEPLSLIRISEVSESFKDDIILSSANMTVDELDRAQLVELKLAMYSTNKEALSSAEKADIDFLISDDEVKEYYKGVLFTYEDFLNTSSYSNFDNMVLFAKSRKSPNIEIPDGDAIKSFKDRE